MDVVLSPVSSRYKEKYVLMATLCKIQVMPTVRSVIKYRPTRYNSARMFPLFSLSSTIVIAQYNYFLKLSCLRLNNGDKNYDHSSNYPRQPNLASNLQPLYIYIYKKEKLQHEHNTWNSLRERNGLYCFIKAVFVG